MSKNDGKNNEKRMKLTLKEEAFCLEYVKLKNASDAYRKAYDTKAKNEVVSNNAYVLLQKPRIKARLAQFARKAETLTILSAQQILDRLTQMAEKKNVQPRDRLKALELLGKYRKLFTEKVELKGADGQAFVVASLSERLKSARERTRTDPSSILN
jgi:phage terminase small subunit